MRVQQHWWGDKTEPNQSKAKQTTDRGIEKIMSERENRWQQNKSTIQTTYRLGYMFYEMNINKNAKKQTHNKIRSTCFFLCSLSQLWVNWESLFVLSLFSCGLFGPIKGEKTLLQGIFMVFGFACWREEKKTFPFVDSVGSIVWLWVWARLWLYSVRNMRLQLFK